MVVVKRDNFSDKLHRLVERAVDRAPSGQADGDVWGQVDREPGADAELLREPLDFETNRRPGIEDTPDWREEREPAPRRPAADPAEHHGMLLPSDSPRPERYEQVRSPPPAEVIPPPVNAAPQLGEVINNLWRRKWLIAALVAPIALVTLFYVLQTPARYTTGTLLSLESRDGNIHGFESFFTEFSGGSEALQAEIATMRSQRMLDQVIERLGLQLIEKEQAPSTETGDALTDALAPATDWFTRIRSLIASDDEPLSPEELKRLEYLDLAEFIRAQPLYRGAPTNAAREHTFYERRPGTRGASRQHLCQCVHRGSDRPKVALDEQSKRRCFAVRWKQQRERVQASELAVDQKRKALGLVEGGEGILSEQQVSELSSELVLARSQRAEAQARLRQMEGLARGGGGDSAFAGFDTPLLDNLRQRKAELRLQKQDFARRFNPEHPDVEQVNEDLAALQAQIDAELNKILGRARNEYQVAASREASLKASMDSISQDISRSNTGEVELRAFEREAESDRNLLNELLSRLNQAASQDDVRRSNTRCTRGRRRPKSPMSRRFQTKR